MFGGIGDDELNGTAGNDFLNSGSGDDLLRGGTGADTFEFLAVDGHDTIRDFGNNVDTIQLDASLVEDFAALRLLANVVNGNLVITFYPDTSLTLNNVENLNALLDDVTYLDLIQVEAEQRSLICCRFRGRQLKASSLSPRVA